MVWCLRAASKWQFSTGKDVSEKGSAFCRQWNNCRRSLNWVQEGGRKESPWQVEIFFCSSSILEALVNENDWLENESKLLNLKKKIFFPPSWKWIPHLIRKTREFSSPPPKNEKFLQAQCFWETLHNYAWDTWCMCVTGRMRYLVCFWDRE